MHFVFYWTSTVIKMFLSYLENSNHDRFSIHLRYCECARRAEKKKYIYIYMPKLKSFIL